MKQNKKKKELKVYDLPCTIFLKKLVLIYTLELLNCTANPFCKYY